MPAGRPTEYTPELVAKAREYLSHYEDEGDVIPSVAGLASFIDRARSTLYAWADDPEKKEFSDILDEIMEKQERKLTNSGLKGDFNAPITKLMLTKHGYQDKQNTELTGKDGESLGMTGVVILPSNGRDQPDDGQ